MAMGMVAPTVKAPHALSARVRTKMIPRPARAMTRMNSTATMAVVPATDPISDRAISASDRPPRRVDAQRAIMSWTAPARQQPARSHMNPGAQPNCVARTGPTSGPAPVMAAKW